MTKHQDLKSKLLDEVIPVVKAAQDNLVEKLEYETVMDDFQYLQMCYNESLRINPPVANSTRQNFTHDTELTYRTGGKKTILKILKGT